MPGAMETQIIWQEVLGFIFKHPSLQSLQFIVFDQKEFVLDVCL